MNVWKDPDNRSTKSEDDNKSKDYEKKIQEKMDEFPNVF